MEEEPKRRPQRVSYELVQCRSCGSAVVETLARCPYCGRRMAGHEQKVVQQEVKKKKPSVATGQEEDAQPDRRRKLAKIECKYCRKKIPAFATKCRFCGNQVELVRGAWIAIVFLWLALMFVVMAVFLF